LKGIKATSMTAVQYMAIVADIRIIGADIRIIGLISTNYSSDQHQL
jgi:hypothetical protein